MRRADAMADARKKLGRIIPKTKIENVRLRTEMAGADYFIVPKPLDHSEK